MANYRKQSLIRTELNTILKHMYSNEYKVKESKTSFNMN